MQAGVKQWVAVIGLLFLVALARCSGPASPQAAEPTRAIRIPAIGVNAPVQPLTVDQNGVLPPPDTNDGTGWWRDGPDPANADRQSSPDTSTPGTGLRSSSA